jgi:protein-tyrosine sulfotransferase
MALYVGRDSGIVILGHPRSGTTLLRRLIGGHSRIACPGETHIFSACSRFLQSERTAASVDMGVLAGLSFAGFSDEEILERLRDFAFRFPVEYAKRIGKPRWAEKTAFDIFYLNEIEKLCGNHVYFVGIIRHPLDVAVSCIDFSMAAGAYLGELHRYIQRYAEPLEAFCHSWRDTTLALIEFSQRHPGNCVICRYEDLVEDQETTLTAVLESIGEKYEPSLVESLKDVSELGFSDHKSVQQQTVTRDSLGRWHHIPSSQLSRLAAIVNDVMTMCEYDQLDTSLEITPEEARRRYAMGLIAAASSRHTSPDSTGN